MLNPAYSFFILVGLFGAHFKVFIIYISENLTNLEKHLLTVAAQKHKLKAKLLIASGGLLDSNS